ncbi:MAG: membrane dipeptidase [Sphingobacteriia bacterium]|nr:membrane dipeptidase [Sphingobacteriia bacterium]
MRYFFVLLIFIMSCSTMNEEEKLIKKALEIHKKVLTIDSHTDTPLYLTRSGFDLSERHDGRSHGSRLDLPRMEEGGLDAVFFAVFLGQGDRSEEGNKKAFQRAKLICDSVEAVINRNSEKAALTTTPEEALELAKEGKRAIFTGLENGYPIGNDLSLITYFYNRGIRYITLCHTDNNDICDSSTDTTEHNGLSEFGEKVVAEMNRLGMMIDVSHISDSAFFDVIRLSEYPVIASHSSARAICNHPRNLNDDMLKALAKNGGVAQVCLLGDYVKKMLPNPQRDSAMADLRSRYNNFRDLPDEEMQKARTEWQTINVNYPPNLPTVKDLVDHIDHMVSVAGIDHVGIGSDFDGGGGLEDCFDVSQFQNITIELVKRGYTEEDIKKIWGGNLIRVMKAVQPQNLQQKA